MGFISLSLQGFKQQALAVSTDPEHRFELALQLGELKIAYQLAVEAEVRAYSITYPIFSPSKKPYQTIHNGSQELAHCCHFTGQVLCPVLISVILTPAVGAEVEAVSGAGYQQVPIRPGPGVPAPRPGLRRPAPPRHSLR